MKVTPLFDRVVIKNIDNEETTKSGIVLAGAKEKQEIAEIIAVGDGGMVDGKQIEMQVKVGQKILYTKYAGSDFKIDGEEFTILRQSDILAIID